jgi:hypothetical protein
MLSLETFKAFVGAFEDYWTTEPIAENKPSLRDLFHQAVRKRLNALHKELEGSVLEVKAKKVKAPKSKETAAQAAARLMAEMGSSHNDSDEEDGYETELERDTAASQSGDEESTAVTEGHESEEGAAQQLLVLGDTPSHRDN